MLLNPSFTSKAKAGFVESRAKAMTMAIAVVITTIQTGGYYANADGGGATYKRVAAQPAHAGKFQDASGAWFEYTVTGQVNAKQFGARGDSVTDDYQAITNGLQYVKTVLKGGALFLPASAGMYMTSDTIKLPSYVGLIGSTPQNYPFNNQQPTGSILCANFVDFKKWVVDTETTVGGNPIPYNITYYQNGVADGATFNCTIENILVTSKSGSPMPFGGIRFASSPGSMVIRCGVYGVGTGVLFSGVSGGQLDCFIMPAYYGFVCWDDVNANSFHTYIAQDYSAATTVPADYQWPFYNTEGARMVAYYKLPADYSKVPTGLIVGSTNSGSVGNGFGPNTTIERFPISVSMLNATATNFDDLYAESTVNQRVIVASYSRFNIESFHSYCDGQGVLWALGENISGVMNPNGIVYVGGWGTGPANNPTSMLTMLNVAYPWIGAPRQLNVKFPFSNSPWLTLGVDVPFANGWSSVNNGLDYPAQIRLNYQTGNIEGRGSVTGGAVGQSAFQFPVGMRGNQRQGWNNIIVTGDGQCVVTAATAALNVISFEPTYP